MCVRNISMGGLWGVWLKDWQDLRVSGCEESACANNAGNCWSNWGNVDVCEGKHRNCCCWQPINWPAAANVDRSALHKCIDLLLRLLPANEGEGDKANQPSDFVMKRIKRDHKLFHFFVLSHCCYCYEWVGHLRCMDPSTVFCWLPSFVFRCICSASSESVPYSPILA